MIVEAVVTVAAAYEKCARVIARLDPRMTTLQAYIFRQTLTPFLVILSGLALVAVFSQGLAQLDVIVEQRQSGLAFAWVTILGVPLLMSLILPLALFFAVAFALNRLHSESELVVAQAGGMSNWQIAAPIFKLATVAALAHLAIGALIQPAAYKEMRQTLFDMRKDIASALVRPGEFSTAAKDLVVFAKERRANGDLIDVLLVDRKNPDRPVYYAAATGRVLMVNDKPGFLLNNGQIIQPKKEGGEDVLEFASYTFELGPFLSTPESLVLKASDRTLGELFYPDMTYFFDQSNAQQFLAEGHYRLSAPLLNYAMALIAIVGLLGGEFSRRGYGQRIAIAAGVALLVRVISLGVQAACARNPELNPLQYAFPILVIGVGLAMLLGGARKTKSPSGGTNQRANAVDHALARGTA
jgi:lipopolysaccharide export system permease protein